MYQQAAQDGQGAPGADAAGGGASSDAGPKDDDDVVDADFEEVKKEK